MTTAKMTVRFEDSVLVQEYPITLGCNPGGEMDGPPITIGWEVLSTETMSLKAYERARRPLMRKSKQERTRLLSSLGFGQDEIIEAERQAKVIRTNRIESSDDVDDNDDASLPSSTSSEGSLISATTATTIETITETDDRQYLAKPETHPLDAANHCTKSSSPLPPFTRRVSCANVATAAFSFPRSAQGTKAMLMFQKRRAVRLPVFSQ
jgi:hypothetical protein